MAFISTFGQKWKEAQLEAMIASGQLNLAHHRMCHYGIKVSTVNNTPSSSCFITASTMHIETHLCKCEISRDNHSDDYRQTDTCRPQVPDRDPDR